MKPEIVRTTPNEIYAKIPAPTFANVSAAIEALTMESVPDDATLSITSNLEGWYVIARHSA